MPTCLVENGPNECGDWAKWLQQCVDHISPTLFQHTHIIDTSRNQKSLSFLPITTKTLRQTQSREQIVSALYIVACTVFQHIIVKQNFIIKAYMENHQDKWTKGVRIWKWVVTYMNWTWSKSINLLCSGCLSMYIQINNSMLTCNER